jgi:O-antigen/teichoic acid export membrane protein
VPIVYVDFILGSAILGAADKQRWWALAGLLAIFINITVNFFLIPYTQAVFENGGIGAAIATLATELFVMGFAIALLPKSYFASFRLLHLYKPIISSLLMLASGMFLISIGLHWMLAVVLCGSIYIIGLFLLRTFNDEEIDLIKSMVSLHQFKEFSANKNVSS